MSDNATLGQCCLVITDGGWNGRKAIAAESNSRKKHRQEVETVKIIMADEQVESKLAETMGCANEDRSLSGSAKYYIETMNVPKSQVFR
jgi:hypothetical protein